MAKKWNLQGIGFLEMSKLCEYVIKNNNLMTFTNYLVQCYNKDNNDLNADG